MAVIEVQPTHVVLTTAKLISAWTGYPVAVIKDNINPVTPSTLNEPNVLAVLLIDPVQAAHEFTMMNKHLHKSNWSVGVGDIMRVYGNKRAGFGFRWLPDDAIIGVMHTDQLSTLHKLVEIEGAMVPFAESTKIAMRNYYCTCQAIMYDGRTYYYAIEACALHGKYNPNDIASCLTHRRMPIRMASSFRIDKNAGVKDVQSFTVYGTGLYIDGVTFGVYASSPNDKFGHSYYFIPARQLPDDYFAEIERMNPTITIVE